METIKLRETDEFIKLGQALKAAGLVDKRSQDQGSYSGWNGHGKRRG